MEIENRISARGRPREFDAEKALDRALKIFWRKGYEGTSLPDLTKAMGINRPSLYAAFGNKESLFLKALDHYAAGPGAYVRRATEAPTARAVAEGLLLGAADLMGDPRHPPGCLMVQGALSCGSDADRVRKALIARRAAGEAIIRERLERAKSEGDLPPASDPVNLARFLATVIQGMAVQAAGGAGPAELRGIARSALNAWPA
jgi:AcrR family transcriptional regulator